MINKAVMLVLQILPVPSLLPVTVFSLRLRLLLFFVSGSLILPCLLELNELRVSVYRLSFGIQNLSYHPVFRCANNMLRVTTWDQFGKLLTYPFPNPNKFHIIETIKRFLGNCPPTPPLSQHFALSEKQVLMLA